MKTAFQKELETLLNRCSMEVGSDTPDFILASYLTNCLNVFNVAVFQREMWHGRKPQQLLTTPLDKPAEPVEP